ncbi:hypothetical protein PVAP13_7NG121417 [Panicum virgatum]|uniref:Uncharacterized protein n=1 Tax=Panicum virgatum TaxID=38727 RepID=A0A8T0PU95_PANVG|nr:hypothetical protein PVAP13_7NG121417 [Panicum virgatum]
MVPSSWNNFLQPLLRFAVVRSNHGEGLVRISLSFKLMSISFGSDRLGSVSLLHRGRKRKKKDARRKKKIVLVPTYRDVGRHSSLLSVCLRGLLFDFLHRFVIEIWSCLVREYFEGVVCILMMYSALI